jgi:Rod binding domain-containing protein
METLSPIPHALDLVQAGRVRAQERLVRNLSQAGRLETGSFHDLKEAAQEFESYVIASLLKVMRETVPTGWLESDAQRLFLSWYEEAIGRIAAERGGLGLGALFIEQYGTGGGEPPSSSGPELPIQDARE